MFESYYRIFVKFYQNEFNSNIIRFICAVIYTTLTHSNFINRINAIKTQQV